MIIQTGLVKKELTIIGIVTELMKPPVIYMNKPSDESGNLIVFKAKNPEDTGQLEREIESTLQSDVNVQMTMSTATFKTAVIEHLWIIAVFLIFLSYLPVE